MKTNEAKLWSQNIAENYRTNIDRDAYSQLIDAAKELSLDYTDLGKRWQLAGDNDLIRKEGIYFILTGEPYPGKKGYTWG